MAKLKLSELKPEKIVKADAGSTPISPVNEKQSDQNEKKPSQWEEIKTKGLDFIIISSIFFIFLLCPAFFTGLVAQGLGFEKMMLFYFLVLIGVVAWVIKGVVKGGLGLRRTPLDLPIVATLIFFIISTIVSVNQKMSGIGSYGNSTKGLAALVAFILFYYLLINNINANKIKVLFWAFLSSTAAVTAYSMLQLFGIFVLPFKFAQDVSFNPIGSLSGLTMFLVMALPLLIVAVTQLKTIHSKLKKFFAVLIKSLVIIIALADLTILAFLNGFTFWPVAIVSIIVLLMFFLARIIKITNNNLIIPITVFFLLIIFLVLGNFNIINLNLPDETSLSRSASWEIARESVKANPFFGSGPATFYYSFSKFKSIDFNASQLWNVRFSSAAGAIFEFLATVGILGTLSVVAVVVLAFILVLKTLIKPDSGSNQSILLALFASFISVILLSSLFAINNSIILISILISVLMVAAALTLSSEKPKEIKLSLQIAPKYSLAVSALFLVISAGVIVMFTLGLKMYMADTYARAALDVETIKEKIEKLNKAVVLAPYQDIYHTSLANLHMSRVNQAIENGEDQKEILTNLNLAIKEARIALDISPEKADNNEFLALIYENASYYTQGGISVWAKSLEDSYNKVIELEPNNPVPYFRIALVNVARANVSSDNEEKARLLNEAINNYSKAVEKKADFSEAYYGKAVVYERLANFDEAISSLTSAVVSSGQNIDYTFELGRMYFNRGIQGAGQEEAEVEETVINEETGEEEIIKTTKQRTKGGRNDDLNTSEQIFLSILKIRPEHANAQYSLALLYQALGETDNMNVMVNQLLQTVQDETQKAKIRQQFQ